MSSAKRLISSRIFRFLIPNNVRTVSRKKATRIGAKNRQMFLCTERKRVTQRVDDNGTLYRCQVSFIPWGETSRADYWPSVWERLLSMDFGYECLTCHIQVSIAFECGQPNASSTLSPQCGFAVLWRWSCSSSIEMLRSLLPILSILLGISWRNAFSLQIDLEICASGELDIRPFEISWKMDKEYFGKFRNFVGRVENVSVIVAIVRRITLFTTKG